MERENTIKELNVLENEGIDITKRSQKDDCILRKDYDEKNHLEKVFKDYNLWCEKTKKFIEKYRINSSSTGFFFEADSIPRLTGLYQYRTNKEKSRKLLDDVQFETKKKLEHLRRLGIEIEKLKINSLASIHLISDSIVVKDKIFLVLDEHFETPIRFAAQNSKGTDTAIKNLHDIAYIVDVRNKKIAYDKRIADNINNGLFKKTAVANYMKTNKLHKPTLVKKSENNTLVLKNEIVVKTGVIKNDVPNQYQHMYIDKTR